MVGLLGGWYGRKWTKQGVVILYALTEQVAIQGDGVEVFVAWVVIWVVVIGVCGGFWILCEWVEVYCDGDEGEVIFFECDHNLKG